ncbi:MAG: hypothetical protein ACKO38_09965 [Planctomycetota bacterium]
MAAPVEHANLEAAFRHVFQVMRSQNHSFQLELSDAATRRVLVSILDQAQVFQTDLFGLCVVLSQPLEADQGQLVEHATKLKMLGFNDISDDGATRFCIRCDGDSIKAGQIVQTVLHEVYGRSPADSLVVTTTDYGTVSAYQRLRWLVLQAIRRRDTVLPESALIRDFLARSTQMREQSRSLTRRLEQLTAAQTEHQEMEGRLAQQRLDLKAADASIDRLSLPLGKAAFMACLSGLVSRTRDYDERLALHDAIMALQVEHGALAPSPSAGFLAKTKAVAQQLAVMGKLKLEEFKISGVETSLGRKLIAENRDAELECPATSQVLGELQTLRLERRTRLDHCAATQALLDSRKQDRGAALGLDFSGHGREFVTAIRECQQQAQALATQIQEIEEQFIHQLPYESTEATGTLLGDLVEGLRALKRQADSQAANASASTAATRATANSAQTVSNSAPAPSYGAGPAVSTGVVGALANLKSAVSQPSQLQNAINAKLSDLSAAVRNSNHSGELARTVIDSAYTGKTNDMADEASFAQCRRALNSHGVDSASLRLLFNSGVASSLAGRPVWHVALTDHEAIQIAVATSGVEINRAPLEAIDWELKPNDRQSGLMAWRCAISDQDPLSGIFANSEDVATVSEAMGRTFYVAGRALFEADAYRRAQLLLSRVAADCSSGPDAANLIEAMGRGPTAAVTLCRGAAGDDVDGEHTEVESVDGYLQLDARGLEFTPVPFVSANYLRVPPERVLNFARKTGQFPAAMIKAAKAKRAAGSALRSATRLATFLSDDPGLDFGMRVAGNAASSALNHSSKLGPRPQNRIVMLVQIDGEKQRLNFDASGDRREEIEQVASAFCEQAEAFRERFGRNVGAAKSNALSPSSTPSPLSTPSSKPPSTVSVEASPTANSPTTPPMTKVVGCPKCNSKLRVGKPGVVGCPKCGSKIRVAENLFNPGGP